MYIYIIFAGKELTHLWDLGSVDYKSHGTVTCCRQ